MLILWLYLSTPASLICLTCSSDNKPNDAQQWIPSIEATSLIISNIFSKSLPVGTRPDVTIQKRVAPFSFALKAAFLTVSTSKSGWHSISAWLCLLWAQYLQFSLQAPVFALIILQASTLLSKFSIVTSCESSINSSNGFSYKSNNSSFVYSLLFIINNTPQYV